MSRLGGYMCTGGGRLQVCTVTLKKRFRKRRRRGAGTLLFRREEEKHINHPETSVHMLLYNSVKALLTCLCSSMQGEKR
ncbi:uncharacterized [Tachysurus ichikawai]